MLLFVRTASFDAIVLAYFLLANWLGSPFGRESSGEALHGGQRYPVDMLIPRMSGYSLRVCGCYLLDWCEKSHRWCNERAINWLVVNWPRVSKRCYWSSLVSSDTSGHVSPALSKRELMSHLCLFCFSRITRFSMGLLLLSVVQLISLVVGCWESSFSCSIFSN